MQWVCHPTVVHDFCVLELDRELPTGWLMSIFKTSATGECVRNAYQYYVCVGARPS